MAETKGTIPGILRNEIHEQNPATRTAALEKLEVLRPREYVRAGDEYDDVKHKNEEHSKKFNDLDYNLRTLKNHTRNLQQKNEEIDCEIDKVLWSQNRAKLALASQQILQYEIIETMERHKAKVRNAGNEDDNCDQIFNKRQVLIEKIYSLKKELQAKKKETEQNDVLASKIGQENLILRKRNQAMLVRLARQHQEVELRHQQTSDKLTTLRERLKLNATNIGQEKEGK